MPIVQWNDQLKEAFNGYTLETFDFAPSDYRNFDVESFSRFLDVARKSDLAEDVQQAFRGTFSLAGGQSLRIVNGAVLTKVGVPRVTQIAQDVFPRLFDAVLDDLFGNDVSEGIQAAASLVWNSLGKELQDAITDALTEAVQSVIASAVETMTDGAADAVSTAGYIGQIVGAVIKIGVGIARIVRNVRAAKNKDEAIKEMLERMQAPKAKMFDPAFDAQLASVMRNRILKSNEDVDFSWTPFFLPPFYADSLRIVQLQTGYALDGDLYGYGLLPRTCKDKNGNVTICPDPRRLWTLEMRYGLQVIRNTADLLPLMNCVSKGLVGHCMFNGFPATMRVDWEKVRFEWANFAARLFDKLLEFGDSQDWYGEPNHWWLRLWMNDFFGMPMEKMGGCIQVENKCIPSPNERPVGGGIWTWWAAHADFSRAIDLLVEYQRDSINSLNVAYTIQDFVSGLNIDPVFSSEYAKAENWIERARENKKRLLEDPSLRWALCRLDRDNIRDPEYRQKVDEVLGKPANKFLVASGPCMQLALTKSDNPLGNDTTNPPPALPPPPKPDSDTPAARETFMRKYGAVLAAGGISATAIYLLLRRTGKLKKVLS